MRSHNTPCSIISRSVLWLTPFALSLSFTSLISEAHAQAPAGDVVEYDFEEDVIDGSTKSPEELYINSLKSKTISNLITIRKDFKKEIIKSAEGI